MCNSNNKLFFDYNHNRSKSKAVLLKNTPQRLFFLLFLTKFLIPEPKAAQTDIERGQIIKAVIEINENCRLLVFHL